MQVGANYEKHHTKKPKNRYFWGARTKSKLHIIPAHSINRVERLPKPPTWPNPPILPSPLRDQLTPLCNVQARDPVTYFCSLLLQESFYQYLLIKEASYQFLLTDQSVVSNSLQPHGLYSPWNYPGQNTGVGSLSLLQVIFPTQGLNLGLPRCRFFTSWATREARRTQVGNNMGKQYK